MMKLTAYREVLKMGKEAIQSLTAPLRANEMRKKAELEIAQLDSKIAENEQKVNELCSSYPIDFNKLIRSIDDLALLERRRKQFNKIVGEMFPD